MHARRRLGAQQDSWLAMCCSSLSCFYGSSPPLNLLSSHRGCHRPTNAAHQPNPSRSRFCDVTLRSATHQQDSNVQWPPAPAPGCCCSSRSPPLCSWPYLPAAVSTRAGVPEPKAPPPGPVTVSDLARPSSISLCALLFGAAGAVGDDKAYIVGRPLFKVPPSSPCRGKSLRC
ncbi:hypothetical protein BS78_K308000 [Paspalum vaginatum]|uniref:Uncharacterized protein n=1 Tax=Paspalum vaginatum TaxID=158149 RepID=A0A9W8CE83_9POAL|nr:hypothetical protein BS78_K308000 [Paspalum vaginatum]